MTNQKRGVLPSSLFRRRTTFTGEGKRQQIGAVEAAALVDAMHAARPLRPPPLPASPPRHDRPGVIEARRLARKEVRPPVRVESLLTRQARRYIDARKGK